MSTIAPEQVNGSHAPGIVAEGRTLLPRHRDQLTERGLDAEFIRKSGIYSETNHGMLAALLNWERWKKGMGGAIVIPYFTPEGEAIPNAVKLRPDRPMHSVKFGGKRKYESPKGVRPHVYFPPGMAHVVSDPAVELIITEGEFKALLAQQKGFPTIGLNGVHGASKKGSTNMLPEMEAIIWKNRLVFIGFDSDIVEKEQIQLAEKRLAGYLMTRGAQVRVLRFPPGPNGEKVGIDDYLVAHGEVALRKLLDAAEEPTDVDGTEKIAGADLDPSVWAKKFLEANATQGKLHTLRFYRGQFYAFTGRRYREYADADLRARIVNYLDPFVCRLGSGVVSNIIEHVKALTIVSSMLEMPAWIDGQPPFPPEELLAARNGLVHLPSLIAGRDHYRPSTPHFFSCNALDLDFDINASLPAIWLQFLAELWPDDQQSIDTLQEFIGLLLTGDTTQQKMLMLVGPKRSGKGTIARIIRAIIGADNMAGPTLAGLATNFGLWPLVGKMVAIISDARLSGRTDTAIVTERLLSITGEDAQTIDRKCMQPITTKLGVRFILMTNELPRLHDSSGALAGRMIVLRLVRSFYGREDHKLTSRLMGELPSILLWAIEGWRRLNERGRFIQPEGGREVLDEMSDLASPVAKFIRERCVREGSVAKSTLYEEWKRFCAMEGKDHPGDAATFGRNLRAVVPEISDSQPRTRGNDGTVRRTETYIGISLIGQ